MRTSGDLNYVEGVRRLILKFRTFLALQLLV